MNPFVSDEYIWDVILRIYIELICVKIRSNQYEFYVLTK